MRNSNDLFGLPDASFDVVLCSMMLMDCEDLEGTLREAARVLRPEGRLFASVLHPCFDGNHESGIGRQGTGIDRRWWSRITLNHAPGKHPCGVARRR